MRGGLKRQSSQLTTKVEHNHPDVVIDQVRMKWTAVDFAMPYDVNVANREDDKVEKYQRLAAEVSWTHRVSTVVVLIVVGALGDTEEAGWLFEAGIDDFVAGL